jgi:hypothetical protein
LFFSKSPLSFVILKVVRWKEADGYRFASGTTASAIEQIMEREWAKLSRQYTIAYYRDLITSLVQKCPGPVIVASFIIDRFKTFSIIGGFIIGNYAMIVSLAGRFYFSLHRCRARICPSFTRFNPHDSTLPFIMIS